MLSCDRIASSTIAFPNKDGNAISRLSRNEYHEYDKKHQVHADRPAMRLSK